MKLVDCDVNLFDDLRKAYNKTKNLELLEEFLASDKLVMRVEGYTHKSGARGCAASLSTSIRNYKLHGVKAGERNGHVYLYRTDK